MAFEGGHHQRGFARTVFGLHVQVARSQQRLGGLERSQLQGQHQPDLAVGVARIGIKAPAQQGRDGCAIVAPDGREKVIERTGLRAQRQRGHRDGQAGHKSAP